MRAAVYYSNGGPEVFRYEEVADPICAPHEVLYEVEAVSIEGGDTLNRIGGELATVPHIVGYQAAGTVREVGALVTNFVVGDRVVATGTHGSHASLRTAGASFCWKIPEGLSTELAACVPIAFGTAHDCLFEFGMLEAGQSVLIHAGASGVGLAAIQLAKRAGATVYATASSNDRLDRLSAYGLDYGINYTEVDFEIALQELTGGGGVDIVVDSVGGPTLQKSLRCLGYRGRCLTFGDAGRAQADKLDISTLRGNNQRLIGYFLGAELFFGTRAYAMIESLLADVASGKLEVVIDKRFALEAAGEAHAYIENRLAFGRVVLTP